MDSDFVIDEEKDSIADAMDDYSISVSKSVPTIYVLKLNSREPSIRGIRYGLEQETFPLR